MYCKRHNSSCSQERGFVLIATLIIMVILLAVLAGVIYSTTSERANSASDQRKNFAFYAAEAGMEKLTADLGGLYAQFKSPTVAQITGLGCPVGVTCASEPGIQNAVYSEFVLNVVPSPADPTKPNSVVQNISSGPNAGLIAQIIPITLQVTANSNVGEQVRMIRNVEVALIPVFQFGVFSDSDLSFFPGPTFDFNGRVFTNGDLYMNAQSGPLTFHAKVAAVNDIVRKSLPNGVMDPSRSQPVNIPTAPNGCDGAAPACRALALNEGSSTPTPQDYAPNRGAYNPNWVNISTTTYGLNLQNKKTGTTPLNLSFVQAGVTPYEIIRRPPSAESPLSPIGQSRLYNQAQVRILLNDNDAQMPGGPRVTDINLGALGAPGYTVSNVGPGQYFAEGIQQQLSTCVGNPPTTPSTCSGWDPNWVNPLLPQSGPPPSPTLGQPWPLISGWLRVEFRDNAGNYHDVTSEWLNLGFARGLQVPNSEAGIGNTVHPNAILDFQFPADNINTPVAPYNYYPINLYDPREGEVRDVVAANASSCAVAGVMNVIELDMGNLKSWLAGGVGVSGPQVESTTQNGYIIYFSDRRGMQLAPGATELNGEYGFEDVVNRPVASGAPNGVLDPGEDVNGNGILDNYGVATIGNGLLPAAPTPPGVPNSANANADPYSTRIPNCYTTARVNQVTGPRHAIKLINGTLGNLPVSPTGGGVTVASENPVYVQGNFNANSASGFGNAGEVPASVIADAVTLLSVQYTDARGLQNPTILASRPAASTYFRLAIAGGKNINFPQPTSFAASSDYGTDGGVHNFLRFVENWNPAAGQQTAFYEGSMVSLYYARQAVGAFKCCTVVYGAPHRRFSFDTNFLNPAQLPPGTPRFQDIDNLGYHQDYTPQ